MGAAKHGLSELCAVLCQLQSRSREALLSIGGSILILRGLEARVRVMKAQHFTGSVCRLLNFPSLPMNCTLAVIEAAYQQASTDCSAERFCRKEVLTCFKASAVERSVSSTSPQVCRKACEAACQSGPLLLPSYPVIHNVRELPASSLHVRTCQSCFEGLKTGLLSGPCTFSATMDCPLSICYAC